jgi:hypothetical protein
MSRGDRRNLLRDRVGLLFERGVPALAAGWFLFLLVPLSSTGLAFPSFLLVFGLTVLVGTLSLGLVLHAPARQTLQRCRVARLSASTIRSSQPMRWAL